MLPEHQPAGFFENAIAPSERLQRLLVQSIQTLETILQDETISVQDRATIALKIAELASRSPSFNSGFLPSFPTNHAPIHSASAPLPTPLSHPHQSGTASQILQATYIQLDDFLSDDENAEALDIALSKQDEFVDSTTDDGATYSTYRQSSNLYATLFPEFYDLLKARLLQILPSAVQALGRPPFLVEKVEMQMTAHNDGCYYKVHNDSGSAGTATRELSYIYYFHHQPKRFSGGELRIYDTEFKDGTVLNHAGFKMIEPRNNSIVFFPSYLLHEVMPVKCPSQRFEYSRFSLNGWLRRASIQWSLAPGKPLIALG